MVRVPTPLVRLPSHWRNGLVKLFLKSVENTSYKGQKVLALCDESGARLPYCQLNVSSDDATGVMLVTAQFKADGKNVILA